MFDQVAVESALEEICSETERVSLLMGGKMISYIYIYIYLQYIITKLNRRTKFI